MIPERQVTLSLSDFALITQVVKEANEVGLRAEREVSRLRFRLDDAEAVLDELRKQLT